jgi:hypothetical protein
MAARTITILNKTYNLPEVSSRQFQTLQTSIESRKTIIQTGQRPDVRGRFNVVTAEEIWSEIDHLAKDYEDIVAELEVSQSIYRTFFGDLAAGVQQALMSQVAKSSSGNKVSNVNFGVMLEPWQSTPPWLKNSKPSVLC